MKRYPYIFATVIATLLAVVVWVCVPKEYAAVTKLCDEYKEMDLAIGLDRMQSKIKEKMGTGNMGLNDMEVYCKILKTEDFAREISHVRVPGKNQTYGEYLCEEDTIEEVLDHIEYNYSYKKHLLTIQFTDRDALVSAQMLDSVTAKLQEVVTSHRREMAGALLLNARKELAEEKEAYRKVQKRYADYLDSHFENKSMHAKQEENALEHEMTLAQNNIKKSTEKYVRQLALLQRSTASFAVVRATTVPQTTNSFFASYLLTFVIIANLLTLALRRFTQKRASGKFVMEWGDFFSPWSLTVVIWTGDILLYYIQGTLYPLGPKFIGNFAIWIATFIPASLAAFWLMRDDNLERPVARDTPISVNMYVFYGFVAISLLLSLLYAKRTLEIVGMFDTEDMLANIRTYAVYKTDSMGVLIFAQGVNFAIFLVAIWLYPKVSGWMIALIVIINLILELSMMEKSGILLMIISALFMLYEKRKIKVRSIGLAFAGIIVLFFFFNMSKENAQESAEFTDFFGMYITSPIVAFETLRITITDGWGVNSFNDVFPYLKYFGIQLESIERLQEFVHVPVMTNVYTVMQPFYNDFGSAGVAMFGMLYGWGAGYVYRRFYDGSAFYKCFYTFLVEVIIIQFYNENFLQQFHIVAETFMLVFVLIYSDNLKWKRDEAAK